MQLHVLGSVQRKLQTHIVERLGNLDSAVEVDTSSYTVGVSNIGLDTLCGRDVQRGVHGVACKLHIASVLNGEGLQRDERQSIFHFAV